MEVGPILPHRVASLVRSAIASGSGNDFEEGSCYYEELIPGVADLAVSVERESGEVWVEFMVTLNASYEAARRLGCGEVWSKLFSRAWSVVEDLGFEPLSGSPWEEAAHTDTPVMDYVYRCYEVDEVPLIIDELRRRMLGLEGPFDYPDVENIGAAENALLDVLAEALVEDLRARGEVSVEAAKKDPVGRKTLNQVVDAARSRGLELSRTMVYYKLRRLASLGYLDYIPGEGFKLKPLTGFAYARINELDSDLWSKLQRKYYVEWLLAR